jgi:hypothetical protein
LSERLSAIRSAIESENGDLALTGFDSAIDELTNIIKEIRDIHSCFLTDHIDARFRAIEEKLK